MAEKIGRSSPVYEELCKLFAKHEEFLFDWIVINFDPRDMPSDMGSALERVGEIEGGKVFILNDGSRRWLIPAVSELDALLRVKALVRGTEA